MTRALIISTMMLLTAPAFAYECGDALPTGRFTQQINVDGRLLKTSGKGSISKLTQGTYKISYLSARTGYVEYILKVSPTATAFGCAAELRSVRGDQPVQNLGFIPGQAQHQLSVGVSPFQGKTWVTLTSVGEASCEGCQAGNVVDNFLELK